MSEKKRLKRFTFGEIDKKVAERKEDVPEYYELLMACAVSEDAQGVTFDSAHPKWKELVRKVKAALQNAKGRRKRPPAAAAPAGPPRPLAAALNPGDTDLLAQIDRELKADAPDTALVRECCKVTGVPEEVRGRVWKALLTVRPGPPPPAPEVVLDLHNQRVIRADVERTLPHLEAFRTGRSKQVMEELLTRYCKERGVSYKQGMNYVMAPFFLVGLHPESIYACFCQFIDRFQTNTFTDDEFGGLQCMLCLFRLALQYHDPELCAHLDGYDMGAELYAASWFITLYANRLATDVLFAFWDALMLESDPHLHFFVSLALLISRREHIMSTDPVSLPQELAAIRISSRGEVAGLLSKAKLLYRGATPQSLRRQLRSVASRRIDVDSKEHEHLLSLPCLAIEADEVVRRGSGDPLLLLGDDGGGGGGGDQADAGEGAAGVGGAGGAIKFFVLDCRPRAQFDAGHLPCAHHVDPKIITKTKELAELVESLSALKGSHYSFMTESGAGASPLLTLFFLQKGFKFVSTVEGGYRACHALTQAPGSEYDLVDHDSARCRECSPRGGAEATRGFFSSFRRRLKKRGGEAAGAAPAPPAEEPAAAPAHAAATAEYKAFHSPETVMLTPSTVEAGLLQTLLRDRKTTGERVFRAAGRLAALSVGVALDSLETVERDVTTALGGRFTGTESRDPVCAVALDDTDERLVRDALEPLVHIVHGEVGALRLTAGVGEVALSSARLPDDVASRAVFLYASVLSPDNDALVAEAVRQLVLRGAIQITVVCLVCARQSAWRLSERYEGVLVVAAAVDDYSAGRLVPGVGDLHARLAVHLAGEAAAAAAAEVGTPRRVSHAAVAGPGAGAASATAAPSTTGLRTIG